MLVFVVVMYWLDIEVGCFIFYTVLYVDRLWFLGEWFV